LGAFQGEAPLGCCGVVVGVVVLRREFISGGEPHQHGGKVAGLVLPPPLL